MKRKSTPRHKSAAGKRHKAHMAGAKHKAGPKHQAAAKHKARKGGAVKAKAKSKLPLYILAGVAVLAIIAAVVVKIVLDNKKKATKEAKKLVQEGPFAIGEKMSGESNKKEGQEKIRDAFTGVKRLVENETGKDIQEEFRKLKKGVIERATGVLMAPPGVQPGTLVRAPLEERRSPPLFDTQYGYSSNGPSARYDVIRSKEKLIMDELGNTQHSWTRSNNLTDGITGETWGEKREDWGSIKVKSREMLQNISRMFDDLFRKQVFPEARAVRGEGAMFRVRDETSGQCIMLERYYEYVSACIAAQLGSAPTESLSWAKGSKLELGFENIDKSIPVLREGLTVQCSDSAGYEVSMDDTIKALSEGKKKVSYSVIWPQDQTVLYTHEMKLNM